MLDYPALEKLLRARTPLLPEVTQAAPRSGDLHPDSPDPTEGALRRAAVLIPLIDRQEGITVLLTRRTEHLRTHAGQISFPGGAEDPADRDAIATALRELHEEVGIPPAEVDVLGALSTYMTITEFRVTPVIGVIGAGHKIVPDEREVAEAFEVPLAFLMDPANLVRKQRSFRGRVRHYYAIPYGDYYIWGATAAMLLNLRAAFADHLAVGPAEGQTG